MTQNINDMKNYKNDNENDDKDFDELCFTHFMNMD